jgi:hypothetical protein
MSPGKSFHQMPQGRMPEMVRIECAVWIEEVRPVLEDAFWGSPVLFLNWLVMRLNTDRPAFERTAIAKDIEENRPERHGQMALL